MSALRKWIEDYCSKCDVCGERAWPLDLKPDSTVYRMNYCPKCLALRDALQETNVADMPMDPNDLRGLAAREAQAEPAPVESGRPKCQGDGSHSACPDDADASHIEWYGGAGNPLRCCGGEKCCYARLTGWKSEPLEAPAVEPTFLKEYPGEFLDDVQVLIAAECDGIRDLLLEKNRKYGNSALEPARIFSKASPVEQILVRIDDKLSRLRTMGVGARPDEDTVRDLIGYLVLLRVAQRKEPT